MDKNVGLCLYISMKVLKLKLKQNTNKEKERTGETKRKSLRIIKTNRMERYATDLTLSFGFCFYFPLWLFFNFLISCLALPCLPVCKPEAVGRGIAIRAEVVQEGR